ncbi:MAG TPA: hypothetical protein VGS80_16945 [Ktedonobacterales bacterium]|nr:hypothetical protein [Ktedonobacterales bacterium]
MVMLRIEHPVPDYAGWRRAFDSDPANRRQSSVRHNHILRALDDPNYVMIDLEFDSKAEAGALLAKMRVIWERAQGTIMSNPQARIVETVERVDL